MTNTVFPCSALSALPTIVIPRRIMFSPSYSMPILLPRIFPPQNLIHLSFQSPSPYPSFFSSSLSLFLPPFTVTRFLLFASALPDVSPCLILLPSVFIRPFRIWSSIPTTAYVSFHPTKMIPFQGPVSSVFLIIVLSDHYERICISIYRSSYPYPFHNHHLSQNHMPVRLTPSSLFHSVFAIPIRRTISFPTIASPSYYLSRSFRIHIILSDQSTRSQNRRPSVFPHAFPSVYPLCMAASCRTLSLYCSCCCHVYAPHQSHAAARDCHVTDHTRICLCSINCHV